VAAANAQGRVSVASGQSVVAGAGEAPQPYALVRPRDAVQWGLYYPPVDAVLGGHGAPIPLDLPSSLRAAVELAGQGDTTGAFAALHRVPRRHRDARFHLLEASLLLSVGRVDEARTAIDIALGQDPSDGLAYALRSVISVTQNEREQALADARRGVELEPQAAAPKIALSYVQQAHFELEAARDTLLQATEEQPQDALAWARLAELWLMLGYRHRAREAAERAADLAPGLERVQVVRGYAALAEIRTREAREAFEQAILLDSSDPLPRFGLGLAMIRDGALEDGRRHLEMAVGLDSSNALLRSYLGKAYFEERRRPLDAEQLAIAKELDPLDPTPYLYDAIRKQTENKPGEALADIQASIARNENRAVYRSRLALDQDRAARGTSLGRIYDDLGFQQLGVNEAAKSLTLDPANASAHRFLSDIYLGLRRRESARVSELLQAQLLQDININPVQPSLSETNLNVVTRGGPAEAGFNEFTPLFERNQVQLNASGLVGNDDTFGGESVVSAIYGGFSASVGAFHYQTDGWRPNNDIDHDIYNVYLQGAITPELNVQMEFRHRDSEQGDLALNFDPDFFSPTFERALDQDMGRLGVRYSPTPNSDVLLSFIYSDREETQAPFPGFRAALDDEGYQIEGQYLYRQDRFNLTAGFSHTGIDSTLNLSGLPPGSPELEHLHGYAYANVNFPSPVTWTVGASFDEYQEEAINVSKINPKLGVQWDLTEDLRLRGAVFRTVKPALVANRTIEPTQVAGFNQLFDDGNADEAWRYGLGLDWQATDRVFVGAEATWRDITASINIDVDDDSDFDAVFEDENEQLHRAYVYWLPIPELSLSAEVAYDRFEAQTGVLTDLFGIPEELETFSIPLAARYFHPSGVFAGVGATFVDQRVVRTAAAEQAGFSDGSDQFFVVDAAIGYRFPDRRGIASLTVNNLFDEKFLYQDDSFREFRDEPSIGPYLPAFQVVGRVTLSF
jgi:tetratricopeptide (TPR) repeat protein